MSVRILTTGGTIDKVYFDALSEFQVGDPQIAEVLRHAHVETPFTVEPVLKKDSLEISAADRAMLRAMIENDPRDRILVTHGTDTMAETGRFLSGLEGKTIVLTGALAPARFRENDAVFNIGFAFASALLLPPGVYLAIHGRVFDPHRVRKNRAAGRFEAI